MPLVRELGRRRRTSQPGQVVLLENCRVNKGEKKNDDALAQKMAALCDIYVQRRLRHRAPRRSDHLRHRAVRARSPAPARCWRPRSTRSARRSAQPKRPLVAIVAGSKVSTKLTILKSLADKVDQLIVGGGIANTFMLAAGLKIGKSLAEADLVDEAQGDHRRDARRAAPRCRSRPTSSSAKEFAADAPATVKAVDRRRRRRPDPRHRPGDRQALAAQLMARPAPIVWNGPVGVFEFDAFAQRHRRRSRDAIAKSTAFSIAGGGDTLAAIAKYGIEKDIGYISTGGGAFLEFLEGKTLPAFEILQKRASGRSDRDAT